MASRIYIVTDARTGAPRLVKAGTVAQALGFVTRSLFSAVAANAIGVAKLMGDGIALEDATEQPAQAADVQS